MHLFSSYIQPLTDWLKIHNNWALFITFIISFSESLAIIGSIVPGSITMTAIGILAGSGVMRIDLTFLSAVLGAIAGDSLSYLLGFFYRDRLVTVWPLKKYPQWLVYGKEYFTRHGGKSVLIGRFIGPLRSLIPVIAGMMHMDHWRFLVANVISAAGWAFLYIAPGILIGAASNELSPESATELFIFILLLLGIIWLMGICIRWILSHLARSMRQRLHKWWANLLASPTFGAAAIYLTPIEELNYYNTTFLFINLLFTAVGFLLIALCVQSNLFQSTINEPVYLFLQSLHTNTLDVIAIAIVQLISKSTILTMVALIGGIAIYKHDLRSLYYWISLNLSCLIFGVILHHLFIVLPPNAIHYLYWSSTFPDIQLLLAIAQFSALVFYFNKKIKDNLSQFLTVMLPTLSLVVSLSLLYLGDNWLTDIVGTLFLAIGISLVHWIFYRRYFVTFYSANLVKLIVLGILLSSGLSLAINFKWMKAAHQISLTQFITTESNWWVQKSPQLPVFRINRVGKPVSLFNFQYVGSLGKLETSLVSYGWQKKNENFLRSLLERINDRRIVDENPLMTQLYLNRIPSLIMTYHPKNNLPIQTIRIWQSNVHVMHYDQPIWIGTISFFNDRRRVLESSNESLDYVSKAVPPYFLQKKVLLPLTNNVENPPQLLLVREPNLLINNKND